MSALKKQRKDLENQEAELEERRREQLLSERRLESREELLREDQNNLDARVDKLVDRGIQDARHELEASKKRVASLQEELDRFEQRSAEYEDWRRRFGQKEPEEWIEWCKGIERDRDRLRGEMANRPTLEERERLLALEEERRTWEQRRTEMARELSELEAKKADWVIGVAELERQRDMREVAERRRETLQVEMEKLREETSRLRSLYEQPKVLEARKGNIEEPRFVDVPSAEQDPDVTELNWLKGIQKLCGESGMEFPTRLLHAFHTSLKTSEWTPMTVLGGVSGTGKSELPRLYSRFGGIAFEPVSVQPNWDSPQSLFGFYNSIDGRFNATPLLNAMVQSQFAPDSEDYRNGLGERLLLVLLDEMNLAHVELYFSELLSKLELRRGEKNDTSLEFDLGGPEYKVALGRNVLWVGTMNEDETTKSLSDKVIDRSNLLGFPRPSHLRRRKEATLADRQPMLPLGTWNRWLCHRSDLSEEHIGKYKSALEEINRHMERAGRALGHRVWQSVESYLANYPKVRAAIGGDEKEQDALTTALRIAFEDALVHKVMPKLRGVETSGSSRSKCLDPIGEVLSSSDLGLHLREDFELACSVGYAFVWRSAKYLEAGE